MAMFGRDQSWLYNTPPIAPATTGAPVVADAPQVHTPFFGRGGAGRAMAGYLGDAMLSLAGAKPMYAPMMADRRQHEQDMQMAQLRAVAQNMEEPASVKALRAAGIDPTSPQGQQIIRDNLSAPRYMTLGSPETGQMIVNPGAMPPAAAAPSAPAVGTVQDGYVFAGGDPSQPTSWRKQ